MTATETVTRTVTDRARAVIPVNPSYADVTEVMRRLISSAGSLKRWGKFAEEAEVLAEVERLRAVRLRLKADRELARTGARYEDYVRTS